MRLLSSAIVLLATSVFGQAETKVYLPQSPKLTVYKASGELLGRRSQTIREPILISDSVKLVNGSATLPLNSFFGNGRHNIVPTNGGIQLSLTQVRNGARSLPLSWSISADKKTVTISVDSSAVADSQVVKLLGLVR